LLAYSGGANRVSMSMARNAVADFDGVGDIAARREPSGWLPHGVRSITSLLGLGLLGAAGFATGNAILNRHPRSHQPSMIVRASLTQAPAVAAAATIDPGTVAGASAPKHAESQPPHPDASLSLPGMRIISAEAAAPAHPARTPKRFVIVVQGDTLGDIAVRYLGSNKAVATLMRLNPRITDPGFLYPGEVVYLPPQPAAATTTADATDVE
jgi:LysM repeat protein